MRYVLSLFTDAAEADKALTALTRSGFMETEVGVIACDETKLDQLSSDKHRHSAVEIRQRDATDPAGTNYEPASSGVGPGEIARPFVMPWILVGRDYPTEDEKAGAVARPVESVLERVEADESALRPYVDELDDGALLVFVETEAGRVPTAENAIRQYNARRVRQFDERAL